MTGLQNTGFNVAGSTPTSNPYAPEAVGDIQSYTGAGPQTVTANSIASQMSPYMNQYVAQALAPQEQALQQQFAGQDQQLNAAATSAGAFGDARAGIEAANLTNQQDIAQTGLLGQAYTNAFNTAIGAGAQDVSNQMQAQQATGNFAETALNRQLAGANALTGVGTSNLGYATGEESLLQGAGGIQQQQQQAELNVPYSNYLAAQQYPFLTAQALEGGISSGVQAMPASTVTTTQQPNNAGYALAGAIAPALFNGGNQGFSGSAAGQGLSALGSYGSSALSGLGGLMMLSDEREKENINKVGKTDDGVPVVTYNYKRDPTKTRQIGVIAQDLEKKHPAAVKTIGKRKYVSLDALDAAMGRAA